MLARLLQASGGFGVPRGHAPAFHLGFGSALGQLWLADTMWMPSHADMMLNLAGARHARRHSVACHATRIGFATSNPPLSDLVWCRLSSGDSLQGHRVAASLPAARIARLSVSGPTAPRAVSPSQYESQRFSDFESPSFRHGKPP